MKARVRTSVTPQRRVVSSNLTVSTTRGRISNGRGAHNGVLVLVVAWLPCKQRGAVRFCYTPLMAYDSAYQADWYQKNKAKRKAQLKSYDAKRVAANKKLVVEYLQAHPCQDCGESDIVVLEFDHVNDDKDNSVAVGMFRWGASRLQAEIEKCEVVCANCHKRRTDRRAGNYRVAVGSNPT